MFDFGIGTYLKTGAILALITVFLVAYVSVKNVYDERDELREEVTALNVVITGKNGEINELKNEVSIKDQELENEKQRYADGQKRVAQLSSDLKINRERFNEQTAIWDKRFNRLASPFQNKPGLTIKLINSGTKKVFKQFEEATSSKVDQ